MNYRSFIFVSCIGLALVLGIELYASSWSAGRPVKQWQRGNDGFQVRVTEHVVPHFPLDRYHQIVESAPAGSPRWSPIVTAPGGRGLDITPDQVSFFSERMGSVYLDNKLFVTTDGGINWKQYEFARGTITKVIIAEDGQGMVWMEADAASGKKYPLRYETSDYGHSWSRAK